MYLLMLNILRQGRITEWTSFMASLAGEVRMCFTIPLSKGEVPQNPIGVVVQADEHEG